jgi:hypothetical protein
LKPSKKLLQAHPPAAVAVDAAAAVVVVVAAPVAPADLRAAEHRVARLADLRVAARAAVAAAALRSTRPIPMQLLVPTSAQRLLRV